jgi:hypothetical protein
LALHRIIVRRRWSAHRERTCSLAVKVIFQDGVTFFVLDGGKDLKVGTAAGVPLRVDEIKDDQRRQESLTTARFPTDAKERPSGLRRRTLGSI